MFENTSETNLSHHQNYDDDGHPKRTVAIAVTLCLLRLWEIAGKFDRCGRNCRCDVVAEASKTVILRPQLVNYDCGVQFKTMVICVIGTVWTTSSHIITAVIGSGVLSLTWAIAQLGWIAGTVVMLFFSGVTWYTSSLLADCYRTGDSNFGSRNYTFMDAVSSILDCPHSKEIWLKMGALVWDNFHVMDVKNWLRSQASGQNAVKFMASLWGIWKWRNNMVFEEHPWLLQEAWNRICHDHDDFIHYLPAKNSGIGDQFLSNNWCPPPSGYVKLNVDGSFDEMHNRMGGGGVFRDDKGNWMFGFMSSNSGGNAYLAEMEALKEGLTIAWSRGYKDLICEVDCSELLEDLDNQDLLLSVPALRDIHLLLKKNWNVALRWVHRTCNIVADCLAKAGRISEGIGVHHVLDPSPEVATALIRDSIGIS